jgi:predicted nucleic acid-binding protein
MTDGDALFVDTNILVFLTNSASPWHSDALRAISDARAAQVRLVISTQVVREYLAVGSREVAGAPGLPRDVVVANANAFRKRFDVLSETADVLDELLALVDRVNVSGKQIHDANIVATMRAHGIRRPLTHNVSDFLRFDETIEIEGLTGRG